MKILFVDSVCPKPYSYSDLETSVLGGTEATCIRIAQNLAQNAKFQVGTYQRNKETIQTSSIYKPNILQDITYYSPELALIQSPDVCITLRDAKLYVENVQRYGKAVHYLWLHDEVSGNYQTHLLMHLTTLPSTSLIRIIVVSEFHKQNLLKALAPIAEYLSVTVIYNPIASYCTRTTREYDKNKLIFPASPHKGLDIVLGHFNRLKLELPDLKLYIANPGYYTTEGTLPKDVISLGPILHRELIEQVRTSLCTFYPQYTFEETFGLILAESNAIGTPVLSHRLGAAEEVLDHPDQFVNARDPNAVVAKIKAWHAGERPVVMGKKAFNLDVVTKQWAQLLTK